MCNNFTRYVTQYAKNIWVDRKFRQRFCQTFIKLCKRFSYFYERLTESMIDTVEL